MQIIKADMWESELTFPHEEDKLILFTGCNVVTRSGYVMGAGAALEAKTLFPDLPQRIAEALDSIQNPDFFGVVVCTYENGPDIGSLQTKYHFSKPSPLELLERSIQTLEKWLPLYSSVAFNFPCIGYGGKTINQVLPFLKHLPDKVRIYLKE